MYLLVVSGLTNFLVYFLVTNNSNTEPPIGLRDRVKTSSIKIKKIYISDNFHADWGNGVVV